MGQIKNNLLNEFETYIQTKGQYSLKQFKTRWEDIIARYSKPILDEDVVDLFTGEIIEDQWFIKSVKPLPFGSMINTMEDEEDSIQTNLSNKKDIKGKKKENEENNFVYDENDFDNLLVPKKNTLLQVISQRVLKKTNKIDNEDSIQNFTNIDNENNKNRNYNFKNDL
ncbi:hypothetical protein LY90DRAFT_678128 [Neocallimastix californiae]|uniref:Uncharacterized protein n=1 Tax=Neocallimastix californiae TaxID=1754190 RepID=A0A1Y1ZG70_9FUNG|nr:hypothetical protein LY90DRAFT_678128 [Neocallimastix californiae]|eukprot:ORY09261.1 hypothetical protein LY90DRAFT_678128 [Neocallimastix californiae]